LKWVAVVLAHKKRILTIREWKSGVKNIYAKNQYFHSKMLANLL